MKKDWKKKNYDDGTDDFYYALETELFDILLEDGASVANLYWNTEGIDLRNNREDLKNFTKEFYELISRYTIDK